MRAKPQGRRDPAMTTYPKSKAGRKATAKKARAVLCILASPEARLLLIGEHTYILKGREHIYLCSAVYEELRAQAWISPPQQLGDEESGILAATITDVGRAIVAQSGPVRYQQMLFEEIEAYIE